MILTQQFQELVKDVKDDMTNGKSGTADTLFLKTQTGLISPIADTDVALSDLTNTTSSISGTHVVTTALGVGHSIIEDEVNNGTESYNRAVKAVLVKTSQIEYNIFHTFDFEIVP